LKIDTISRILTHVTTTQQNISGGNKMRLRSNNLKGVLLATAMIAGSASIAMADNTDTNGWQGNDTNGWYYYEEGQKATGWKFINNVWYYFDKTGLMAQDELVYISGETYYLNPTGAMATGWYSFDNDSDILYNYDIDVSKAADDIQNPVFKTAEEAYEKVWLYFHSDGTAADDEWFQSPSGLWYYFDDILMVAGDFDHIISNSRYGFDENGAMLVGWAENYNNQSILAPNKDSRTWYYYESNGKKFDVDSETNRFGWKRIGGEWYCFKSELNLSSGNSVGTLIVDTLFNNGATADTTSNFFYVDKNGVMATGVTTVSKDAVLVENRDDWGLATPNKVSKYSSNNVDILFDDDGKAKAKTFVNGRYYADANDSNVNVFDTDNFAVTDYTSKSISKIKGALVKNAFVEKDDKTYYVDKYGDSVTSHALQIGYITDTDGVYSFSATATGAANEHKAYAIFDNKGVAYDDVAAGRTVSAGSKKYISSGIKYSETTNIDNVTIFFYKN